jgi:hypothetical protein
MWPAVVTFLHSFHPPTTVYSALRIQLARPHQDTHLPTCTLLYAFSLHDPIKTPTYPRLCSPPHTLSPTNTPTNPPPCTPPPCTLLARTNTPTHPPPCSPPRKLNVHPPTAMFSTPRTQLARELRETRERYTALELVVQTKDTDLKRIREQLDAATREVCVCVCQCFICACVLCVLVHNSSVQACDSVHHECHKLSHSSGGPRELISADRRCCIISLRSRVLDRARCHTVSHMNDHVNLGIARTEVRK